MTRRRSQKELQAFVELTDKLLAVPKETLDRRLAEYDEQAKQNPKKRGPKPKTA